MPDPTPEDRARLRDLAHRMLEAPVRGAASAALAEGVTALLDALDQAERERDEARATKDMHKERAERIVRDGEAAIAAVERVREALARHPRACDKHPEGEPVSCGWKRAVMDVQAALDGEV